MSEILDTLNGIRKQFEPFDSIDLISKLSALRLSPHNGDHSIRLDAILHAASSRPIQSGQKIKASRNRENIRLNTNIRILWILNRRTLGL